MENSNGAVKTAFDIQVNGKRGPGRPKMIWKQLTERDRREWKLSAIDPHDRDTWRSGVRSAMRAASQLPGRGGGGGPLLWIWPLYLHINQKSDDDDDVSPREAYVTKVMSLSKNGGVPIYIKTTLHTITDVSAHNRSVPAKINRMQVLMD